jgi:UDP-N-acetylmuramate--alanine ligase
MDLTKIKKIYFIGIKGVGMTMLAQYFAGQGIEVCGSDVAEKFMTDESLKNSGIRVIESFDPANLPKDADLIIYSSAYNAERNIEVKMAQEGKIPVLTYAEALGEVFRSKYGIAVAGSHGKTTTTAWLGYVLEKSGLRPSVMVGSFVPQFAGNSIVGNSDYLVVEVDEYQNKLQYFNPKIVLLNNIDYDHPDFFSTVADYEQVFIEFIKKIPKNGYLIANFDDLNIAKVARVNCQGKVVSYGLDSEADLMAYEIRLINGRQYFKIKLRQEMGHSELGDFAISLMGKHNIYNALAVISACIELDVELRDIRVYLEEFTGTARRMQYLGEFKGAQIYDDYAHHPTEIKSTLEGAKANFPNKKIKVVFHPHTFTRTKALLDDFAKSFEAADEVIVLDIYGSAREQQGGVDSLELVEKINTRNLPAQGGSVIDGEFGIRNQEVRHIPDLIECEKYLRQTADRNDVIILMGAGDVFRVGENLIK